MTVGIGNRRVDVDASPVYLFVDMSNVFLGARKAAAGHGEPRWDVRIHAGNLLSLVCRGRRLVSGLMVANARLIERVRGRFVAAGFDIETREAGESSHTEQANDECLLLRMWELITDPAAERGTIVLVTGDGNGWKEGRGFAVALERAATMGWKVEVHSWSGSLNPRLGEVTAAGGGSVELLDDSYFSVTFVEGGRRAQPVICWQRPLTSAA